MYRLDPPYAALRVGYRVLFERLKYSRKNKLFWQSKFLSLAKKATFVQGANYILLCFVTVYWLYRYYVVVSYRSIGPLKFLCRMLLDDDEVTIIPNRKNRPPNYRRHISFFILITNYHIFFSIYSDQLVFRDDRLLMNETLTTYQEHEHQNEQ